MISSGRLSLFTNPIAVFHCVSVTRLSQGCIDKWSLTVFGITTCPLDQTVTLLCISILQCFLLLFFLFSFLSMSIGDTTKKYVKYEMYVFSSTMQGLLLSILNLWLYSKKRSPITSVYIKIFLEKICIFSTRYIYFWYGNNKKCYPNCT